MASSRHPILGAALELAIKICRKYPFNVATVVAAFIGLKTLAIAFGLTWGFVFFWTLLALPIKWWVIEPEVWLHRHRLLLAGESLPFPGRRKAMEFRRRERKRMKETRRQFAAICHAHGLTNAAGMTPTLRNLRSLVDGSLTCEIYPGSMAIKGGVPKFQKLRDDIAASCGAVGGLRIKPFGVGGVETSAPSAARLTFFFEAQTWPTLPIQQLAPAPVGKVTLGNDQDLKPAFMPLIGHLLLVAMTGKGKSKAIWTLLIGICLKVKVRLFVVDPKGGQEMGKIKRALNRGWIGNRLVEDYASDSTTGAYRVIMAAEKAMMEQQAALTDAGISEWKEEHADEFPMIVLAMDELLTFLQKLGTATTNKPGKAALDALINLLSQGRAAGVKLIMASQASDKEILGNVRTLIPVRLALGTENPTQTGMAFGDMSAEDYQDTPCSQIDEPGLANIKIEGIRGYRLVRVALVDDIDIDDFVETGFPANMGGEASGTEAEEWRPQWIYHYPIRENCVIDGIYYPPFQLVYEGVTNSPADRHRQHVEAYLKGDPKHSWMAYVDLDARPIIQYAGESRTRAEEGETFVIERYAPVGNIRDNGGSPWFGQGAAGVPVEVAEKQGWLRNHGLLQGRRLGLRPVTPGGASEAALEAVEPALDILEPERELEPVSNVWSAE